MAFKLTKGNMCLFFVAIIMGGFLNRLDISRKKIEPLGEEKCLHTVPDVDGPEDLIKFGNLLLISSNNHHLGIQAKSDEERAMATNGGIFVLRPPFDTNREA